MCGCRAAAAQHLEASTSPGPRLQQLGCQPQTPLGCAATLPMCCAADADYVYSRDIQVDMTIGHLGIYADSATDP